MLVTRDVNEIPRRVWQRLVKTWLQANWFMADKEMNTARKTRPRAGWRTERALVLPPSFIRPGNLRSVHFLVRSTFSFRSLFVSATVFILRIFVPCGLYFSSLHVPMLPFN